MKTIVCFLFVLGALSAEGEVFLANAGKKAILECGVDTYSRSVSWRHNHDNKDVVIQSVSSSGFPRRGQSPITARSKVKDNTKLEISSVRVEDAGVFMCEADGRKYPHTLVVVSVSVSVDPSADLLVGSTATLRCQMNPQVQKVQWKTPGGILFSGSERKLNPVAQLHSGEWQCVCDYDGATLTESISIRVKEPPKVSTTSKPKNTPKTSCVQCAQPGAANPGSSGDLLGLSWWVWLSIGIGCLVVILLIVLVIILSKRIKRRKRRLQMMKNAQHKMRSSDYCKCNRSTAAVKPQQGRRREKPSALPLKPC